jgi:DNA-binding transcriptional LysR family regulator
MRLRHIEVIEALVHTGNLNGAAELLRLAPEAVATLLQDAEQELGFLLFAKVRGRLQATRETHAMQAEMARLQESVERLRRVADGLRLHQEPPLRVVGTQPLAQQLLPQAIAALRRRFTDTTCSLASHTSHDIVRSLLLHESDLGLSLHNPEHPQLQSRALLEGKVQLLAPHGWLAPRQKYIALQALAGQSLVGLEQQDPLSQQLENRLQGLRPSPRVHTRVQTYQMMRSMVEAGEGLALVDPFTAAGSQASGIDSCPVSPAIGVTLYALTLREQVPSAAQKTFLDILQEKAEALLHG